MIYRTENATGRKHRSEARRDSRRSRSEYVHPAQPIVRVVSKAATDLNDVLNAVALRSALLRGRPAGSGTDTDIWRLVGLLDRATELVRELQAYVHDVDQKTSNETPASERKTEPPNSDG